MRLASVSGRACALAGGEALEGHCHVGAVQRVSHLRHGRADRHRIPGRARAGAGVVSGRWAVWGVSRCRKAVAVLERFSVNDPFSFGRGACGDDEKDGAGEMRYAQFATQERSTMPRSATAACIVQQAKAGGCAGVPRA